MATILHINLEALNEAMVQDLKNQFGPAELEIKVSDKPDTWLTEAEFWHIITLFDWSKTGDDDAVIAPAVAALAALAVGNIHQFEDILSKKLWLLDTRAHANASLRDRPESPLSADYFLYDRCAVVANGKAFYENVVRDPGQMPTGVSFAPLLSVASKAYILKTGKAFVHIPAYNYETYQNEAGWPE